jgi:hypothetical protein
VSGAIAEEGDAESGIEVEVKVSVRVGLRLRVERA